MIPYYSKFKFIIILTALFTLFALSTLTSASWHGLTPGKYEVGFKTIEKYDQGRTYLSKYDYFGNLIERERARPIQICLWYPAEADPEEQRMVYGEYNFPYPEDDRFFNIVGRYQGQDNGYLFYSFQNDYGIVLDFLSVEMNAVKDAAPADGKFPLLIYFTNFNSGIGDNVLLCEYLASKGYVVATSHSFGTHELTARNTQGDLETIISDKEFIFENIADFPFVDMNKIGSFGAGYGGLAAMLYPMRCGDIDAVMSLNGPFNVKENIEFTSNCPYFANINLTIPFMNIYGSDIGEIDLSLQDSLRYSERISINLRQTPRNAFNSYLLLSSSMPGRETVADDITRTSYKTICDYSLNFFDAYLKNSDSANKKIYGIPDKNKIAPELIAISFLPARDVPPTPAEFVQIIRGDGGVPKAVELYEKFKIEDPGHALFEEATFNQIGYNLLTMGDIDNALEIFRMNSEVYPNSCNVWDSYADGMTAAGDTAGVVECMRKAMEVMPNDSAVNEVFKNTIREHARRVLGDEEYEKYQHQ